MSALKGKDDDEKPEPDHVKTFESSPDYEDIVRQYGGTIGSPPGPESIPDLISKASREHGVPESLLKAQARQESGMKQEAVSPKGARGVMQLMPQTAKDLGVDSADTAQNIDGGARLMAQLYNRFGSWEKALAAYNWRPEKVEEVSVRHKDKWLDHTPAETQHYVKTIMAQQEK
jgi:soluble lytic murein transglycosylase-like protein